MITIVFLAVLLLLLAALLLIAIKLKAAQRRIKEARSQLIQSAKMASIGMLAGSVAHEINNPLIGVLNNIQLIKMLVEQKNDFSAQDFRELLDTIETSALRCSGITRSLLDFSRSSKGVYQCVSLNEIIEKSINLLALEIKINNITVERWLGDGIPAVSADPLLLQQAIFDIVNNACWAIEKKSGRQGGKVTIKTAYEPSCKKAVISILDTGIGIPEDDLKKVFKPFFTTKPSGEGTGLGLSIVRDIINEHNGSIEVESKAGEGSIFKIKLPVLGGEKR
ncbi:MAG: ATP-binding protein [Candidatus Omnitrophota bacterium]